MTGKNGGVGYDLLEPVAFEPEKVCQNFVEITKLPHPSGNEDSVRQWVVDKAKEIAGSYSDNRCNLEVAYYHPQATDPGERVILLRRAAGEKYKGQPPVILQAHVDMVTVPSDHIFPLKLAMYNEDGKTWLKAFQDLRDPDKGGTTLGADDGIGVAVILAVAEDENLKDFPIECFFTVQEETDMGGAEGFRADLLTGNKYLNLDAEDLTTIIYGSAGGCEAQIKGTVSTTKSSDAYRGFDVCISGLRSGHSGVDINKGRLNAIKTLNSVLTRLNNRLYHFEQPGGIGSYDLVLFSIARGDIIKANSIPSEAQARVMVNRRQADRFVEDFGKLCELIRQINQPVESGYKYSISEVQVPSTLDPMSAASTDAILLMLERLPQGVVKMIPTDPALVETSTNLYDISIKGTEVNIRASNRSSNIQSLQELNAMQESIAKLFNCSIETDNQYPAWQPNPSSTLLEVAEKVYADMYGSEKFETTVIHAGLECGWIKQKYGDRMECISIGPTIQNPHTENERLEVMNDTVQTVGEFYQVVSNIIGDLYQS